MNSEGRNLEASAVGMPCLFLPFDLIFGGVVAAADEPSGSLLETTVQTTYRWLVMVHQTVLQRQLD
jgi:hypothetical protein